MSVATKKSNSNGSNGNGNFDYSWENSSRVQQIKKEKMTVDMDVKVLEMLNEYDDYFETKNNIKPNRGGMFEEFAIFFLNNHNEFQKWKKNGKKRNLPTADDLDEIDVLNNK